MLATLKKKFGNMNLLFDKESAISFIYNYILEENKREQICNIFLAWGARRFIFWYSLRHRVSVAMSPTFKQYNFKESTWVNISIVYVATLRALHISANHIQSSQYISSTKAVQDLTS